ncbi:MAG: hypothetical protein K2W96_17785 [Gemmataceae bacterium]|nr:hypothetical protein [Gemmataceae bacterium]
MERLVVSPIFTADEMVQRGALKGATIRDSIRRGQVFGWYFLPKSETPAFPESIIEMRHLQTVPIRFLHQLVAMGKRITRLMTPFREHMAQHLGVTYMRIGLPEPYPTAA